MPGPRDVHSILEDDRLSRLVARARALLEIERAVHGNLNPELARHCRVVNLRDDSLLLATTSAAWATRLRYEIPRLLGLLQRQTDRLSAIRVVVHPAAPEAPVNRRAVPLSPAAAEAVNAGAQSIGDPALSAALARLAKRR